MISGGLYVKFEIMDFQVPTNITHIMSLIANAKAFLSLGYLTFNKCTICEDKFIEVDQRSTLSTSETKEITKNE